jgi:pimeloyl-ACP methyl ester carboxylesterase
MDHPESPLPAPTFEAPWAPRGRAVAATLTRVALTTAWSLRHPREPFATKPGRPPPDRLYYTALDGWEAPLWHLPAPPDGRGDPVVLAHGSVGGMRAFDIQGDSSLVAGLHRAGYAVYLLSHRGDRDALPPTRPEGSGSVGFDFDDIVQNDVPAAIAAIKESTGARRVLWIGHAMGGQLALAHIASGGGDDLAAVSALCSPVRFALPRSQTRLAATAARLLPESWSLPTRSLQAALAPAAGADLIEALASDVDGSVVRGLLLYGGEDTTSGLLRQVARWYATGVLCDRTDRFDYLAALRGSLTPLQVVVA